MAHYQLWLRANFNLTLAGQIAVTIWLLIGGLGAIAGTAFAFYNVEWRHEPHQVLGLQIVFSWIVVAVAEAVVLGVTLGIDRTFRLVLSRSANPS